MSKLEEVKALKAQLAAAEEAAKGEIEAKKREEMDAVLEHLPTVEITLVELVAYARIRGSKYSNANGDTWSGKGKKPAWIEKHLAGGGKLEDVATKSAAAAE